MNKNRLEAFSDAVIAIIITIMVLEFKVPHGSDLEALRPLLPVFLSYVLSFIYLGIYWNNHHHMLQATRKVNGKILWANLNLLFWLSLFPFATAWMGENHFAPIPAAVYGAILFLAAVSYTILQTAIVRHETEENSLLAAAVGNDLKGKLSMVIYVVAVPMAFVSVWVSIALYIAVAIVWIIPDRRIERKIEGKKSPHTG